MPYFAWLIIKSLVVSRLQVYALLIFHSIRARDSSHDSYGWVHVAMSGHALLRASKCLLLRQASKKATRETAVAKTTRTGAGVSWIIGVIMRWLFPDLRLFRTLERNTRAESLRDLRKFIIIGGEIEKVSGRSDTSCVESFYCNF